jgi:NAD(P)-dependent dehydrogenase (short-subunit alcohol dehydrogenase family)
MLRRMGILSGKVAVVTGAGMGIGREEALLLARQGAAVVVNDIGSTLDGRGRSTSSGADPATEVVAMIDASGGAAVRSAHDIGRWESGQALVDLALDTFGRLDIVVNNAGVLRDGMSFNLTEDDWRAVLGVHLIGHAATAAAAGRHWRERSKAGEVVAGRIVNTTSEAGLYGNPGQLDYVAAKAAIAAMTIALARELKRYGVTVNAVAPRARTRMTESMLAGTGPDESGFDPWDPANVAPVVAWLASDDAAGISGQVFVVFGDALHLMQAWTLAGTTTAPGGWTVEQLTQRQDEIFGERGSRIPLLGFGA